MEISSAKPLRGCLMSDIEAVASRWFKMLKCLLRGPLVKGEIELEK